MGRKKKFAKHNKSLRAYDDQGYVSTCLSPWNVRSFGQTLVCCVSVRTLWMTLTLTSVFSFLWTFLSFPFLQIQTKTSGLLGIQPTNRTSWDFFTSAIL